MDGYDVIVIGLLSLDELNDFILISFKSGQSVLRFAGRHILFDVI